MYSSIKVVLRSIDPAVLWIRSIDQERPLPSPESRRSELHVQNAEYCVWERCTGHSDHVPSVVGVDGMIILPLLICALFAVATLGRAPELADNVRRHDSEWPSESLHSTSIEPDHPACWPDCRIYDTDATWYNRTAIKLRQAALLRASAQYTFPNGARAWRGAELPHTALAKLASYNTARQPSHITRSDDEQLALLHNASAQIHRLLPGLIPFGHEQAALEEAFGAEMPSVEDMSGGAMESTMTRASLLGGAKQKPTILELFRRLAVLFSTEGSMPEDPLEDNFEVLLRTVPIGQGTTNDLEHLEHVDSSPSPFRLHMAR